MTNLNSPIHFHESCDFSVPSFPPFPFKVPMYVLVLLYRSESCYSWCWMICFIFMLIICDTSLYLFIIKKPSDWVFRVGWSWNAHLCKKNNRPVNGHRTRKIGGESFCLNSAIVRAIRHKRYEFHCEDVPGCHCFCYFHSVLFC